jgi:glyoxylase-like metal-dependent hydrolase (beta-lactamase superfamily II)
MAGGAALLAADYGKVTVHKVAEGVYLFTTSPYGDVGMYGNSIAVVSEDGVLVFDSAALPETASTILRDIRTLTPKPVRYLLNSHWHWDHWGGNQVYQAAFPGLQIVTHEKTREQMLAVEPRWNDEGLKVQLPRYLASLEKKLAEARAKSAPAADIGAQTALLRADRNFLDQKNSLRKVIPNVTFTDAMTVRLGRREFKILHARAITVGDTYVYLPKERILITGDIMLDPFPFAIGGSYPADWLKTLEGLADLKPAVIIPGHGLARSDPGFLQGYIALFREVIRQVKEAKSKGLTLEQTRDGIRGEAAKLTALLGSTDPKTANALPSYFLDVFVARCYEEQDHPLGDLPGGLREPGR